MNPPKDGSEGGDNGGGPQSIESPTSPPKVAEESDNNMKRAAARHRIGRYYSQLIEGCGRADCTNHHCASSTSFVYKSMTRNDAAVQALDLFKKKADLCLDDQQPSKVAKSQGEASSSRPGPDKEEMVVDEPSTSGGSRLSLPLAGPSPSLGRKELKISPTSPSQMQAVPYLTEDKLCEVITTCQAENSWSKLNRLIGSTFNNPDALLQSFLKSPDSQSKEDIRAMETDADKDTDDQEQDMQIDSSAPGASAESSSSVKAILKDDEVTVDVESVRRAFEKLFSINEQPFLNALLNAIIGLSKTLEIELRYHSAYARDPNYLNIFILIMEIPTLHSPEFIETTTPLFCKAFGCLPVSAKAKLAKVWSKYPREKLKEFLDTLQQMITVKVITSQTSFGRSHSVNDDDGITGATQVMKVLYYASMYGGHLDPPELIAAEKEMNESAEETVTEFMQGAVGHSLHEPKEKNQPKEDPLAKELQIEAFNCRAPVIPWEEFINETLSDQVEMDRDYASYRSEQSKFSFMTHSFILTPAVKNMGMFFDNRIRMMNERRQSLFQSIVHGAPTNPYLRLRIRRDHIIDDALVALELVAMDNPQDLKKQLFVEFEGEQGIDEGGVSKEFFQLVVEEIFNPDIGMFTHDDETHSFWFNSTSFENDGQFTLIGIVLGLAIYNNVILDVHFPMVVYRKLMGKKGTFEDMKDSHPRLAKSLQDILNFDGNVEETFLQTFRIGYKDVFGSSLTYDLKENGDEIPVTKENREEFVALYADYLLNKSIAKQFRAFKRGFQMVTDESPLKMLFRPEEVELLVCGSKHLDFNALEESTDYDGGFSESSPTIKHFWDVVHDLTDDQKRQLLQFTTGSDRVPVGGLSKLKLVIAKNGADSDRLPTSHTCFNVLLLPDYSSKDKLKERLLKAITYAKGFGML